MTRAPDKSPAPGTSATLSANPRPAPAKPVYTCDRCGSRMVERQCKVTCPNCGSRFDCSDLNIHFD